MLKRLFRSVSALTVLSLLLQLMVFAAPATPVAAATPTTTNNPPLTPHSIEVFPQRDFVSVSGYAITETLTIEVIHSPALYGDRPAITTASGLVPQDDPATPEFDGIVEVNHPGGYCWLGNTPDIRPGDIVRVTVDQTNVADATTVAGVIARRPTNPAPGTIVVHGTAADVNGNPLPIDQIEQRLLSPGNLFDRNGRRSLRAGTPALDGLLTYDALGSTSWTATYTGLSAADITRAMEAESRILWLGADPLAAVEATLFEIGAGVVGGPQAPCSAPLEVLLPPPGSELVPPSTPANLAAGLNGTANTVTLTWDAATDNVGVTGYGIYRNGVAIANVSNPYGDAPAPTGYVDYNVPPGAYTYTVDAQDEIGNRSGLSNEAAATTVTQFAPATPGAEPPVSGLLFTAFPSRDFAEIAGFHADDVVSVMLIRDGVVVSTAPGVHPHDLPTTPEFDGVVEVNHPGGYCWAGLTPEIRAGDILRAVAYDHLGNVRVDEQITVANITATTAQLVTADDPMTAENEGVVKVTGTAQDAAGNPIDIAQLEARLVSNSANRWEKNDRRVLIAASPAMDGALTYDTVDNPTGTRWTAIYEGLSFADVERALSVESRIMWLGRDPLAGVELTIFEVGSADPPGPSPAFCTTPLETPDTLAPSAPSLSLTPDGDARTVSLSWTQATDDTYVYGYLISRDGQPLRYVGAGVTSYLDTNVLPGLHTYTVQALDSASPRGAGPTFIEQLQAGQGGRYGNLSSASAAQTVTMPDVTAPTVPASLVAVAGAGEVVLSWAASTDDVAVAGYNIYKGIDLIGTTADTTYTAAEPVLGTFTYSVAAFDAAGNVSAQAPAVAATVTNVPDITAPTAPTLVVSVPNLRARNIALSWSGSTDEVGVTGYRIYRDGALIATVNGVTASYLDSDRPAETYSYTVKAFDSAGNLSDASNAGAATVANDPPLAPYSIIAFPTRDFVSADGYAGQGAAVVSVYRNGALVSASEPTLPVGGLVEINHVDAGCWLNVTPDIRAGDLVRVTGADGVAQQTIVEGVFAGRPSQTAPGTITVKGVAIGRDGLPIPAGQLEHRLLSVGANFTKSGANTLRADSAGSLQGSLSYDAPGSVAWTAVYTGLTANDVTRALNGESHIQWLGVAPLAGVEGTIFENATDVVGGPEAGFCTAPLEGFVPLAGLSQTTFNFGNVIYTPVAATSAPRTFTLTNVGAAELTLYSVYLAGANPGDYTIVSSTCASALVPGGSCAVQVTFTPRAMGARPATLNFLDTAANSAFQTITLNGTGVDAAAPTTPGAPAQTVSGAITNNLFPVRVSWAASTGTVTAYQLERSTNNGTSYTPVTLADPTATSVTLMLGTGANRFRVRACNDTTCSAYATGANITLAAVQQNGTGTAVRGTWTNANVTGAYGGTVRFATANTASHSYAPARVATTMQIAWVATKGPDRGRATVQIDGANVATIDLYAPTEQPAQVVYVSAALAANRSHTMNIVVLGNRNPASTGNRVDVDGFITMR